MTASFRIDQPDGAGSGTMGVARSGLWRGRHVTLTALTAGSYSWAILAKPGNSSATLDTGTEFSQVSGFTPDVNGTYRIRLVAGNQVKILVVRVDRDESGNRDGIWALPAFREAVEEDNEGGNERGSTPVLEAIFQDIWDNLRNGGEVGPPGPPGPIGPEGPPGDPSVLYYDTSLANSTGNFYNNFGDIYTAASLMDGVVKIYVRYNGSDIPIVGTGTYDLQNRIVIEGLPTNGATTVPLTMLNGAVFTNYYQFRNIEIVHESEEAIFGGTSKAYFYNVKFTDRPTSVGSFFNIQTPVKVLFQGEGSINASIPVFVVDNDGITTNGEVSLVNSWNIQAPLAAGNGVFNITLSPGGYFTNRGSMTGTFTEIWVNNRTARSYSVNSGSYTLSGKDAFSEIVRFHGSLTGDVTIYLPDGTSGLFINDTTGNYTFRIRGEGSLTFGIENSCYLLPGQTKKLTVDDSGLIQGEGLSVLETSQTISLSGIPSGDTLHYYRLPAGTVLERCEVVVLISPDGDGTYSVSAGFGPYLSEDYSDVLSFSTLPSVGGVRGLASSDWGESFTNGYSYSSSARSLVIRINAFNQTTSPTVGKIRVHLVARYLNE